MFVVRSAPPPAAIASIVTPGRMLPVTSRTVPDNVVVDPPDVGGAAGWAATAGAAVDGNGAKLRSDGRVARGLPIIAGAAASDAGLSAGAVLGADAANGGSTFAICGGRETDDGRSSITARRATPVTATAAVQAQRGRNQTKPEDA